MKFIPLIAAVALFAGAAHAQEFTPIKVPSDKKSKYSVLVLSTGTGKAALAALVQKKGKGAGFQVYQFDCTTGAYALMAEGKTLQSVVGAVSGNATQATYEKGTVAYDIAQAVCK